MKGFRHIFVRECKRHDVQIRVGNLWKCHYDYIVVPEQKCDFHLFVGFHELAHVILHKGDKRNYDDLKQRIEIEQEADSMANAKMKEYGYAHQLNQSTSGLIALYLHRGGDMPTYNIEIDGHFIVLYRHGFEIFSNFLSQLPMHPCTY